MRSKLPSQLPGGGDLGEEPGVEEMFRGKMKKGMVHH